MKQAGIGLRTYGEAWHFIFKHKMVWFFCFPVIIMVFLFFAGLKLSYIVGEWLQKNAGYEKAGFFMVDYIDDILSGIAWILLKVLFFFIFAYYSGFIVLVIMSPILSILSKKTEKIITNKECTGGFFQTIKNIFRGIIPPVRNMIIEILIIFLSCFVH